MKTLRTSRQFHGDIISLRGLCLLEDRSFPASLADIVETDGFRHYSGQISSGDVDSTWEMDVWQNGFWSVKSDFHDGGTIGGDFFFLELLLDKNHSVGARLEGSILNLLDSRHETLRKNGSDRWIRENWHRFEASGPTVRLHAAPAVAGIVFAPIVALAAIPFVVVIAAFVVVVGAKIIIHLVGGGTYQARPCHDPHTGVFDDRRNPPGACIEFVPVEPGQSNEL